LRCIDLATISDSACLIAVSFARCFSCAFKRNLSNSLNSSFSRWAFISCTVIFFPEFLILGLPFKFDCMVNLPRLFGRVPGAGIKRSVNSSGACNHAINASNKFTKRRLKSLCLENDFLLSGVVATPLYNQLIRSISLTTPPSL
jgi:hypothetical protein